MAEINRAKENVLMLEDDVKITKPNDFEREKWLAELAIKERESSIKDREVAVAEREASRSLWQTPIGAAIIAAAIAAVANAGVAAINGFYQRELEDRKAEGVLILEAIKTNNDQKKAKDNLGFLLDAHLLNDVERRRQLEMFLKNPNNEDRLPALPTPSGFSDLQSLSDRPVKIVCNGFGKPDLQAFRTALEQKKAAYPDLNFNTNGTDDTLNTSITTKGPNAISIAFTVRKLTDGFAISFNPSIEARGIFGRLQI